MGLRPVDNWPLGRMWNSIGTCMPGRYALVTVSMRVMSAGRGYDYLLKSVVRGDRDMGGSTALTRYYTEEGTLWVKLVVDNSAGANVQIGTPGVGVSTVGTGPGGAFDAGARLEVVR